MANTVATGGAVTLLDVPAVTDSQFSIRNGHFIFSEDYNLLAAAAFGPGISALQSNTPHVNYINPAQLYPTMLSATVPANPQPVDLRSYPLALPMNEEVAWQVSDANSEQVKLFTWIGTPGWNTQLPKGIQRQTVLLTASVATAAYGWSADTNLTQATQLRGGVYAVVGAQCVAAATLAFRINFPRRPLYRGRKTLPGDLATQTYGNAPLRFGTPWLGLWGFFDTFELPLLEVFANAAATVTHTLYLDCIYMDNNTANLSNYLGSAA